MKWILIVITWYAGIEAKPVEVEYSSLQDCKEWRTRLVKTYSEKERRDPSFGYHISECKRVLGGNDVDRT